MKMTVLGAFDSITCQW